MAAGTPVVIDNSVQGKRKEISRWVSYLLRLLAVVPILTWVHNNRVDFQARKSALMEPKRLAVQKFLGDFAASNRSLLAGEFSHGVLPKRDHDCWRSIRVAGSANEASCYAQGTITVKFMDIYLHIEFFS